MMPTILEIESKLQQSQSLNFKKYNISILRNITIEGLSDYLQYLGLDHHVKCNVAFNDFDNTFVDAVEGNADLLNVDTDCVIVAHFLDKMSWDLARNFTSLSEDQQQSEIDRIKFFFQEVVQGIKKQTSAHILFFSIGSPRNPAFGSIDFQTSNGQTQCIKVLNECLKDISKEFNSVSIIDIDRIIRCLGENSFYDDRFWHIGQAPYSKSALYEVAKSAYDFIRPTLGLNKKCLVLDCDNTLWGGIIGEDGLSGIAIGRTYPGSAFYEFQQEIINLYNRGIILALCSKNNSDDVWEVFQKHPDMLLREKHIAAAEINWADKATNIRNLARKLNIGVDSFVFMDDSDFEINLIKSSIPEVHCIQVDKNRPETHLQKLTECRLFDVNSFSNEDMQRGKMYKANASREKLKSSSSSLNDYYAMLEMNVSILICDEISLPRVAQQTQKTNQFNLTTKRYTEENINFFINSSDHDVITLQLDDKFGSSGIVGTAILSYEDDSALIDSLLLSCRVLGRGVEHVFINEIMRWAKSLGKAKIKGSYIRTPKNSQVENFYGNVGFTEVSESSDESSKSYIFDLHNKISDNPKYFANVKVSMR
ncbi:HAD-superfamily phosphatase, subfamily IIIC/FkbH-like domain-containing protein [Maridesulfovibrio ferrireducens]|uniref:HAD-superfamily phosphatase, subfamily IIIC/FkbH-like domain-containing protein n=1 Tax=Maridesulfovibrio ferrireducens TaxID=246191 RepID=A0A1G9CMN1_9BACT|nr:HAD-IIIC family phosphatase [Maridesulfovibrio ferrireducens]SDK52734.1 HAD-superfamily phosphatase, subfamily IIIC/FkbH-like domain-containing protein [Maridesulfovibrio ferrireducens]